MRKRMKQLARGKFEYAKPQLILSEEEIIFEVYENEIYEGEFTIEAVPAVNIRGLVYVNNPRMKVCNPQFDGTKVRIRYQFHANGLSEGLTETGDFIIISNRNEISLSFCVSVSKRYAKTSIGSVKNLYDFTSLAKENWSEAFQLFYHKNFADIIKSDEVKEKMIYEGMIAARRTNQSVEEFLIAIGKKEKINFEVNEDHFSFLGITETIQKSVEIKKDTWGYLEIGISCDADFVRFYKTSISSEDFAGSTYQLEFFIEPQYLHAGKNFAQIQLSGVYETITISIEAAPKEKKKKEVHNRHLQRKEHLAKIMQLYQEYRLKRMVTGAWVKETIDNLDALQALEPEEVMYALMKAQCLIMNRQKQEAKWILDEFKRNWQDKNAPIWGYYLYVMTLMEREAVCLERMTREIETIFYENPDSVLLFWILTFLQEKYTENNALKLKEIEQWVMKKSSSPYLYVEAFYLIWQEPYLLTKLEAFEIRILRWAMRHQAMTKDMAIQIFQIMETKKYFEPVLYEIMCAAYTLNPKPEYIGIICGYLIKGQKYEKKYHKWYEMGIASELRITGLYEAYLFSMDEEQIKPVPKIIQMYFQYKSNLPYQKMAVLYRNIIAAKTENEEIYQKYSNDMIEFAKNQILEGHMDENLAAIYNDVLNLDMIEKDIAEALSRIIFTQKLIVLDQRAVRVIVYQKGLKEPQVVSVVKDTAYVPICTQQYVIFFEDEKGYRYSAQGSYRLEKQMDAKKYRKKCMETAPAQLPYLLSYFEERQNYFTFQKEDERYFKPIMYSNRISLAYKSHLLPEILRFYQMHAKEEQMTEYLETADYQRLDVTSRKLALELAVKNQLFDLVYEKIQIYGIDQIGSSAKADLASHMIEAGRYEEEAFLTDLTIMAFRAKKFDEKILHYLCQYYNGPADELLEIWFAAKKSDIERMEISERILIQMLYADHMVLDGMPVFSYLHEAGGEDSIILAYMSVLAHSYFVEKQKIDSEIFELIEARYVHHLELNDACKLALLRYYAYLPEISDKQFNIEDKLLGEYIRKNKYFAFYKRLAPKLLLKYHLYDKVFLEYRTSPYSRVELHYSRDEDGDTFLKEDMTDVYDGIFVKAFIMFFGEAVQYYISEEHDGQIEVMESNRITNNDIYSKSDKSRYNLLNQMLISNTLQEEAELQMTMKQYAGLDEVTKSVFKLL